jgi:hypothetical protein
MLKLTGTQQEIDDLLDPNKIIDPANIEIEIIEMGHITDAEIDSFGKFSDREKSIIKKEYASHKKGFFPNPICALH